MPSTKFSQLARKQNDHHQTNTDDKAAAGGDMKVEISTTVNALIWCGENMHINPSKWAEYPTMTIDYEGHATDDEVRYISAALVGKGLAKIIEE